jgi:hypothetical protein
VTQTGPKAPFAYIFSSPRPALSLYIFSVEGVMIVCLFDFLSHAHEALDEMSERMMPLGFTQNKNDMRCRSDT